MNKTININLGGFFFHIDEAAYQKLKRYLDAIARSLSDDPQGKNEIISDIEARISELLSEKITDARQVVNEGDIEEVIAIMGQPEDYADAEEGYASSETTYRRKSSSKKLFRDGDDKFLGGVCSGLAYYTGIDTIWVRLAFIVLVASFFSPIAYIILWILLPEAKTTAEKLQMEGEAVNIDNIEKKIRDEYENIENSLESGEDGVITEDAKVNYTRKTKKQSKSGLQEFIDTIGKIILAFFKVIGKLIGVFLIILSAIVLLSLIVAMFSVSSLEILNFDNGFVNYPPFFYESMLPKWLLTLCMLLLVGIPFLILFVLGLRILSSNVKQFSKTTSLSLLGLWLLSLFTVGFSGIEFATSRAYDGVTSQKNELTIAAQDTINVKVVNNDDLYSPFNLTRRSNSREVYVNDTKMYYSNNVKINVKKSEDNTTYLKVRKISEGRNRNKANENAKKIEYNYTLTGKDLNLDAYFLSKYSNMFKSQTVKATLYIPKGVTVFFDASSRNFLYQIDNTDDIYDRKMSNHFFTMTKKGLDCNDCEEENTAEDSVIEDEENDGDWEEITTKNKKRIKAKIKNNKIDIEIE